MLHKVSAISGAEGVVVIGDTAGHIRMWDTSNGIDISTPDACAASFRQVSFGACL